MTESDTPANETLIEAAILDLDGVVTRTASLHERAWKGAFEGLLAHAPFSHDDYVRHVDGRPRLDGVRAFLASRSIALPEGDPADPPGHSSVHSLARLKNEIFARLLDETGVEVFDDAVSSLERWRREGLRTAVVSSSRNASRVLSVGGLASLFDVRVDGEVGSARGLSGKPAPDYFLEAARLLGVAPARAMVVEDAVSGVTAARRGGFGLIVGVSRNRHEGALVRAGADQVVRALSELSTRPHTARRAHHVARSPDEPRLG